MRTHYAISSVAEALKYSTLEWRDSKQEIRMVQSYVDLLAWIC